MKKLIPILGAIALFSFPAIALATPISWDFAGGILQPLQSAWGAVVKANHFQATSTITASIFPYASTTAASATTFCLTGDTCRTTWPAGGTPGGTSGQVQYNANGTFGGVSTTTLGGTANQLTVSNSPVVIGASPSVLSIPSLFLIQLASTTGLSALGNLYAGVGTATSTIQGSTVGTTTLQGFLNVLGTNSTSTISGNFDVTGRFRDETVLSALVLDGADGLATTYGGTSCSNSFIRALSALGVATCNAVTLTADVTGVLPIANGGTNANSFTTSGNGVYYDGTRLATALTTSAVTYPYASTTAITAATASTTNLIVSSAGGSGTRCAQFGADGTISANASACSSSSFGQAFEIDSSKWLSATTTNTYGINANAQGSTFGFGIGDSLFAYASSTNWGTFVGFQAGGQNATTSANQKKNVAFGMQAFSSNSGGDGITAIGYKALQLDSSGSNNVAVGQFALSSVTTSDQNTGVGSGSLTAATGKNNTGIGYQSGVNVTTGYDNIFAGPTINSGGNAITTGGGNIGLGYNIVFPSVSQNLMLNIGNSLFGSFVATSTSTSLPTTMTGIAFGVATSSLSGSTLSVQNASSGNAIASLFNSVGSLLFKFTDGGFFGISSSTPKFPLSINTAGSDFYVKTTGEVVATDVANSFEGRVSPTNHLVLSTGTTTTWTATTSAAYIPYQTAPFAGTLQEISCFASTTKAFLGVTVYINTTPVVPTYFVSSSTVGIVKFTSANTFVRGDTISAQFGTTTTDTNAISDTCTLDATETP